MPTLHTAGPTRRSLIGAGALAGLSAGLVAPTAHAQDLPAEPAPTTAGPDIAIWGSSSANNGLWYQHPAGFHPVKLTDALAQLLGVSVAGEGNGGEVSWQTKRRRCFNHPYKPNFYYIGQKGVLPAQGGVILNVTDGFAPHGRRLLPGTVLGVPCTITSVPGRSKKVRIDRVEPGREVTVGSGGGSYWRTGLEALHRGKVHLIWTGKNNVSSYDQVVNDTRIIFDVEPDTSVVMGHWFAYNDRIGQANRARVEKVNASYKATYGTRYFDAMAALLDPSLWSVPELAPFKIGSSTADKDWMAMGLPPRSIIGTDNMHLTALGNTVIAHGLARFLTDTADLY